MRLTSGRLSLPAAMLVGAVAASLVPPSAGAAGAGDSRAEAPFVDPWWYESMGLDEVHPEVTGEGVTIALLDDGLQRDAPALRGADITMMDSPCLTAGGTSRRRAVYEEGARAEHGTTMASLIVGGGEGPTGPGSGIRGAAPDAKLLFFDLDDQINVPEDRPGISCVPSARMATYEAAIAAGADIISISNGGAKDGVLAPVLEEMVARGDAVFVASNNDTSPFAQRRTRGFIVPSGIPGVLSVNALDRDNMPWQHSLTLRGNKISEDEGWYTPSVAAMGVDLPVPGAWVGADADAVTTGTSPATALTAGVLGLVKERWPEATPNQLIQHAIHYTSRVRGGNDLADMQYAEGSGFGLVAAPEMLTRDPGNWPDENPLLVTPEEMAARYPTSLGDAPPSEDPSPTAEQETEQETGTAAEPAPQGVEASEDQTARPGLWLGLAVALLLALGAAAYAWSRRRRTSPQDHDADPDEVGAGRSTVPGPHDTGA